MDQDKQNMIAVQRLVQQFPVLKAHMLHRLGNLMQGAQGYVSLLERPTITEAERQKYIANALLGCQNVMAFLRECVEPPPVDYTDESGD